VERTAWIALPDRLSQIVREPICIRSMTSIGVTARKKS
jgi:hypothetical protein